MSVLRQQRGEARFFQWLEENTDQIDELFRIVQNYIERHKLMYFLNKGDIYKKFVYFVYVNSNPYEGKRGNVWIYKPSIDEEYINEINDIYECRYGDHIRNLHYIMNENNEQMYNPRTYAELEEFCSRYSTVKEEIYKEILKRESEFAKEQAELEYTNDDDDYYTDEEVF